MPTKTRFKVGVTIHPQQCKIRDLRDAWLGAGLQHFVLRLSPPFDTKVLARGLKESGA
jgi:hypothetical protein